MDRAFSNRQVAKGVYINGFSLYISLVDEMKIERLAFAPYRELATIDRTAAILLYEGGCYNAPHQQGIPEAPTLSSAYVGRRRRASTHEKH